MEKDPVCNMEIDETKAEFQSQYGGKKFLLLFGRMQE